MFSTTGTRSVPVSRGIPRRRAPRPTPARALLVVLLVVAVAPTAAKQPSCFPDCDPMNPVEQDCCPADLLDVPCRDFLTCQEENRATVEECVNRACHVPRRYAECEKALECSRQCATLTTNCSKTLRTSLQDAGACAIGRGAARRACNRCFPEEADEPRVCSELAAATTPPSSRCQKNCIRHQPWIKECYAKCDDRCADDPCAVALCQRSCRDSICELLQNTCSPDGDIPTGGIQRDLRLQYTKCCGESGCDDDSAENITCESTSTTSTSSSSSSSLQTTTTSLRTTTTTLSSTSG